MSLIEWMLDHWALATLYSSVLLLVMLSLAAYLQRRRNRQLQMENARLTDRLDWLQCEFDVASDAAVERQAELTAMHADKARLNALLQAEQQAHLTAGDLHEAQLQRLKAEFSALSEQVLRNQNATQQQQLDALLTPLQTQLGDFRARIDQLHHHSATDRASLQAQVSDLKDASERMGRETLSLAQALKGDQAFKGQWGEVVLESLLEASGLRPGSDFLVQPACESQSGSVQRPDVIVRLPGHRDVVIDAKVSMGDYQLALDGGDKRELARHAAKLKQHVRALAQRNYHRLEAVHSLELVLMFVPLDAALTSAVEVDPDLLDYAMARQVALVSPHSLMLVLHLIQRLWRQQSQHENAHKIAIAAASLQEEFAAVLADLDGLCRQMRGAEKTAVGLRLRLGDGPESVLRRINRLQDLGAQEEESMVVNARASGD